MTTEQVAPPKKGRTAKAPKPASTKKGAPKQSAPGKPKPRSKQKSASTRNPQAGFGGFSVSLLPQELKTAKKNRRTKRRLVAGVILAGIIGGLAVAGSATLAATASLRSSESAAAVQLMTVRLAKYHDVIRLESETALANAAARVGGSTQIDWPDMLGRIKATMPAGMTIDQVAIISASPMADFPAGSTPLDKPRVGSVVLTVKAESIEAVPAWLVALSNVRGIVDAVPSVSSSGDHYAIQLTMHISSDAYLTPLTDGAK